MDAKPHSEVDFVRTGSQRRMRSTARVYVNLTVVAVSLPIVKV